MRTFPCQQGIWQIGEEADHLCGPKLAPDENGAIAPDRVNSKNALRQIQTDGSNLLLHVLTPRLDPQRPHHAIAKLMQESSMPSRQV